MKIEDIVAIIEGLGGDPAYKMSGAHLMFNCVHAPFSHASGEDTSQKLGVRVQPGKALVHCFYPGCFSGTLLTLVQKVGASRVAAGDMTMIQAADLASLVLLAEEDDPDGEDVGTRQVRGVGALPREVRDALGTGSPYWTARGVDATSQDEWDMGEWGGRALIAIQDRPGNVVGVQGRLLPGRTQDDAGQEAPHWTWPVGFPREEILAGMHRLVHPAGLVILVESPADAVLLQQWLRETPPEGMSPEEVVVVASMGAAVSDHQRALLIGATRHGGEVALGMDGDNAGRLAQRTLVQTLSLRYGGALTEITWAGKDPSDTQGGTLSEAAVKERALAAVSARQSWVMRRFPALFKES